MRSLKLTGADQARGVAMRPNILANKVLICISFVCCRADDECTGFEGWYLRDGGNSRAKSATGARNNRNPTVSARAAATARGAAYRVIARMRWSHRFLQPPRVLHQIVEAQPASRAKSKPEGRGSGSPGRQAGLGPQREGSTAVPSVLSDMNKNLSWTSTLGDANMNLSVGR